MSPRPGWAAGLWVPAVLVISPTMRFATLTAAGCAAGGTEHSQGGVAAASRTFRLSKLKISSRSRCPVLPGPWPSLVSGSCWSTYFSVT